MYIAFLRIFIFLSAIAILANANSSFAQITPESYKKSIEEKSKELEEISTKIKETHSNLDALNNTKRTLNNDLKRLDITLNQVNLGIRSSEINLEKLKLELSSLSEQKGVVEESIDLKKDAVLQGIREMNKFDRDGYLQILLRSESLVNGSFEAQAFQDIQDSLLINIKELTGLKDKLSESLKQTEIKKAQVERENKTLRVRKELAEDQKQERKTLLTQTSSKEQVYQRQLTELEEKQEEIAKEVEQLEMELRGQIDVTKLPFAVPGLLEWPVPGGRLTQGYGTTTFAISNYRGKHHNGIDIGKFLGAEIIAAEGGKVVAVANQDLYCRGAGYGKYIVVKHFNGLTTLYGHLSRQIVSVGQEVKRGELIGYMGRTGWATGPHLHFVVWDSSTYYIKTPSSCGSMPVGGDIDPRKYL